MTDTLICEECNTGNLPTVPEEGKVEEEVCGYCNEAPAEALVDGRPSCVGCKTNRKNRSPVPSVLSEQRNFEGSQGSRGDDDSINKTPPEIRAKERAPRSLVAPLPLGEDAVRRGEKSATKPPKPSGFEEIAARTPLSARSYSRPDTSPPVFPEGPVPLEQFQAKRFLNNYLNSRIEPTDVLYNTMNDGQTATAFHAKLDNRGGFIIIIDLILGFKIGAYTVKGLRTNQREITDSQSGGVVIRDGNFELIPWPECLILYEKEGIRFNRNSALYLNFDDLKRSQCSYLPDSELKQWTSKIEEITAYRL